MQIVTFNVHGFSDSEYRDNVYEIILYFQSYLLQNQTIDAICLQEVNYHAKRIWQHLPDMCISNVKFITNFIFEFLNFQELIPAPFQCTPNCVQLKLNLQEEMDTQQLEWLLQLRLQLPTEFILSHELILYNSSKQQLFYKTQPLLSTESKFYIEWKPKLNQQQTSNFHAKHCNPFINHDSFDSKRGISALDLICKALNMYYVVGCANRYYQSLCNAILTLHPPKRYGNYIAKNLDTEERAMMMVQFDPQLNYPISTIFNCHLDHRYEQYRLEQLKLMETEFLKKQNTDSYILCGDFNSLTKTDYTLDYAAQIDKVRERGNWELAHYDVTNYMKQQLQCMDCYELFHTHHSNPSSCRFHTRIDYIYFKKLNNIDCLHCKMDTNCNCSDHFACWASFGAK